MSEKNNKFPIRTKLPAIEEGDPFKYCSFNRENAAENLTNLLKLSEGGFVLAVDNQWGFGKTTFIKMWQQYLKNNEFNTIYFNSWENDFENKPLIAIISEIKNELSTENKGDNFNVVVKKSVCYATI